jgi:hypothetical protein
MNVAVPAPQHSPILGQLPLSQIVFNLWSSTSLRTLAYACPTGNFTLSQSGFVRFGLSLDVIFSAIELNYWQN